MHDHATPEKIPFVLRVSKRATRMRLVVHPTGLEVVAPPGCKPTQAEKFVEQNRDWAIRTLLRICGKVPPAPQDAYADLPLLAGLVNPDNLHDKVTTIELRAQHRTIEIRYVKARMLPNLARIHAPSPGEKGPLVLYCDNPSQPPRQAVAELLHEWLRDEAKAFLPDYINTVADEVGIKRPTEIRIGFQRTLWGSRSVSGRISMNAPLLFLPPGLLRHVVVHELCHTQYMNHGRRFHLLLERLDPEADRHAAELKKAETLVPLWARST